MSVFSDLQAKVRSILKASEESDKMAKEGKKQAAVPSDPGDPDKIAPDYRLDGSSPTKNDVKPDEADEDGDEEEKDEEEGGPATTDTEEEEDEDEGEKPTESEEEGEDDERPVAKGFDDFGNRDLTPAETRSLLKALEYGVTPPMPEEKLLDGGEDLKGMLDDILALLTHQNERLESNAAVMSDLLSEVDRLKRDKVETDRQITKALEMLGSPRSAPAQAPRSVTKSIPTPAAPPSAPINGEAAANHIFSELKAGRMTQEAAMAKCREIRSGSAL